MENKEEKEECTVDLGKTNNEVDYVSLDLDHTNSKQEHTNAELEAHIGKNEERFTSPPTSQSDRKMSGCDVNSMLSGSIVNSIDLKDREGDVEYLNIY